MQIFHPPHYDSGFKHVLLFHVHPWNSETLSSPWHPWNFRPCSSKIRRPCRMSRLKKHSKLGGWWWLVCIQWWGGTLIRGSADLEVLSWIFCACTVVKLGIGLPLCPSSQKETIRNSVSQPANARQGGKGKGFGLLPKSFRCRRFAGFVDPLWATIREIFLPISGQLAAILW